MLHRLKNLGPILGFAAALMASHAAQGQSQERSEADQTFIALQDAATKNKAALADTLASRLHDYAIPSYVAYFRLKPRLATATAEEVEAYLARYPNTAIADRLRNDWLLELGKRRDWKDFDRHAPLFVLKDDLQVKCYALMSDADKGQLVAARARELLRQPTKYGEACKSLIAVLVNKGQFNEEDIWTQIRLASEYGLGGLAEDLAPLAGAPARGVTQSVELPLWRLARGLKTGRIAHETYSMALGRLARKNHEKAAAYLLRRQSRKLTPDEQSLAWAQIALPAAVMLAPEALDYWKQAGTAPLSDEGHEWKARTALRAGDWAMLRDAIQLMPSRLRQEARWVYWRGRAMAAMGEDAEAEKLFETIANGYHFYALLALEALGHKIAVPPQTHPPSSDDMWAMETNPGLRRGIKFFSLGLRTEGMREWSWELIKMNDRELIAAAEYAREQKLLDRMINASLRTRAEFDFTQRYPSPSRDRVRALSRETEVDMTWIYGIMRQESRFTPTVRSSAGAAGLMQVMPSTAKYVARKIKMRDYQKLDLHDPHVNITLGTHYLKMMQEKCQGSQVLASAAYNAGPNRLRAWWNTVTKPMEGAIFIETLPYSETRHYVQNVMTNATLYAALFENRSQSLKARLGTIKPREKND